VDEELVALGIDVGDARVMALEVQIGRSDDPVEVRDGRARGRVRLVVSNRERTPTGDGFLPITLVGSAAATCCADRSTASNCVLTRPAATAAPVALVSHARRDMRALSG
jgi:hypothetical protein